MFDLYNRKAYDLLMSKPNIKAYVKKQTSVTSSELHDQRAKWEEAGMKLPAPLAAFHIGKQSLCTFWNHAKGAGCKREKDGKKVGRSQISSPFPTVFCASSIGLSFTFADFCLHCLLFYSAIEIISVCGVVQRRTARICAIPLVLMQESSYVRFTKVFA